MTWHHTRQMSRFVLIWAWFLGASACWAAGTDVVPGSNATFARLEEIRSAAGLGDANAQFKMGDYYYARGDFTNAVSWYDLAAEQDHHGAQLSLATCYLLGRGVSKDLEKASHWATRAQQALVQAKTTIEIPVPMPPLPPSPAAAAAEVRADELGTRHPVVRVLERPMPELESIQLTLRSYGQDDLALRQKN